MTTSRHSQAKLEGCYYVSTGYLVGGVSYSAGGLWWAGARVLIPIFSPPPSGFFLQGSGGAVVVHPFGVNWSNPGSIGLTLVLSGSIPGVLGDQPKIFGPRTCG